jgi:hypothetical protein
VLRPGGRFVFTVPLADVPDPLERARVEDGVVIHLLPPEYHGDRLRGAGRVLAFRRYGVDIVDRLRAAGLEATIARIEEPAHAITGARVVVARKAA